MIDTTPTTLGFALLGLAHQEPRTGYALRKVFETSPLGRFSSSPGSIYPALRKLVEAGLVEVRETGSKGLYRLTGRGKRALFTWLAQPVTTEEYERDADAVMLRFAFLDATNDAGLTLRFLDTFERAVGENLAAIKAFLRSDEGKTLSLHASLAVDHGVIAHEAAVRWAQTAARLIAQRTSSTKRRTG